MEPLFSAAFCGCNAGLHRKVLYQVYIQRIQQGDAFFGAKVLGARGALLLVLAHFFEHGEWGSPALKAEALHLAHRTAEALETLKEDQAWTARTEERWWWAELHRLCGVFVAALGTDGARIKVSFCEAIRTANEQKSISLAKRAEASYAEYLANNLTRSQSRS